MAQLEPPDLLQTADNLLIAASDILDKYTAKGAPTRTFLSHAGNLPDNCCDILSVSIGPVFRSAPDRFPAPHSGFGCGDPAAGFSLGLLRDCVGSVTNSTRQPLASQDDQEAFNRSLLLDIQALVGHLPRTMDMVAVEPNYRATVSWGQAQPIPVMANCGGWQWSGTISWVRDCAVYREI